MLHKNLQEKWFKMSLAEQMGNIGSEVGRAARTQDQNSRQFWGAAERALELFDLTFMDSRWRGRLKEIGRAREVFCDAILGGKEYNSFLPDLERYFMQFAFLARSRVQI